MTADEVESRAADFWVCFYGYTSVIYERQDACFRFERQIRLHVRLLFSVGAIFRSTKKKNRISHSTTLEYLTSATSQH